MTLSKVKPGVVTLADIPGGIALSTVVNSPLSRSVAAGAYVEAIAVQHHAGSGAVGTAAQQQHLPHGKAAALLQQSTCGGQHHRVLLCLCMQTMDW